MLASIVAYILGVPLWMIIGILILVIWNRRRVKNQPGIFPVKVRPDPESNEKSKWPRGVSRSRHPNMPLSFLPGAIQTSGEQGGRRW